MMGGCHDTAGGKRAALANPDQIYTFEYVVYRQESHNKRLFGFSISRFTSTWIKLPAKKTKKHRNTQIIQYSNIWDLLNNHECLGTKWLQKRLQLLHYFFPEQRTSHEQHSMHCGDSVHHKPYSVATTVPPQDFRLYYNGNNYIYGLLLFFFYPELKKKKKKKVQNKVDFSFVTPLQSIFGFILTYYRRHFVRLMTSKTHNLDQD